MQKLKYEIDKDIYIHFCGRKLHRIRALKNFVTIDGKHIEKGELGGYVEDERNLSQHGVCWVDGTAKVFDSAYIGGSACIQDGVMVFGHAHVLDAALVYGNARIFDRATVRDKARVFSESVVCGDALVGGGTHLCGYTVVCQNGYINTNEIESFLTMMLLDDVYNEDKQYEK